MDKTCSGPSPVWNHRAQLRPASAPEHQHPSSSSAEAVQAGFDRHCTPLQATFVEIPIDVDNLRCRVDSSVDVLQALHEIRSWVPGADQVRPTAAVRAQKELLLANIETMWTSPADWVFHQIFGCQTTREKGKRTAARPPPGTTVFAWNPFPYQVADGTMHWVLWMASPVGEWPDDKITSEIAKEVDERGGGEFIWYANPKMSLGDPRLHHVQVPISSLLIVLSILSRT